MELHNTLAKNNYEERMVEQYPNKQDPRPKATIVANCKYFESLNKS